jgi:hypothetical protein
MARAGILPYRSVSDGQLLTERGPVNLCLKCHRQLRLTRLVTYARFVPLVGEHGYAPE